ncbi:MAG: nucleotidyltransferase [Clostridiales bacterium]|nr:nucleotidyltransferase [Clostridiales bacterium]
MKILGVIVEYNPFHNGHAYHLEKSISMTNATHTIAVMSGNFVQRGEPALMDKWTRAKIAVDNGVNLVIELPFANAISSAEKFAFGSIFLLNQLKIVNDIVFGSESGNVDLVETVADYLATESKEYKTTLQYFLTEGLSFPAARDLTLRKLKVNSKSLNSNDILGIEYIKAIKQLDSAIKYHTLKRQNIDYHSLDIVNSFASATGIRNKIKEKNFLSVRATVPSMTYNYISNYRDFLFIDDYYEILRYKILSESNEYLSKIHEVTEGIENRIIESMRKSTDMTTFLENVKTKRFTMTRIKRILLNILFDIKTKEVDEYDLLTPKYINILAVDNKGLEILRLLKKDEDLNIITNLSKFTTEDPLLKRQLQLDLKASDLYSILRREQLGRDYFNTPYIKKAL